jgi:hypothetical protein
MRRSLINLLAAIAAATCTMFTASPASAGTRGNATGSFGPSVAAATRCPAFVTWQDWLGGARVHAYVDFRPSDWCNGRHVKRAYIRFTRPCGPYLDTGRIYTATASSPSDTRLYSYQRWVWDSVRWSCTTYTNYGYEYF